VFEVTIRIGLARANESLPSRLRRLIAELPIVKDFKFGYALVADYPAIICSLYLDDERFAGELGREFLSMLSYIKNDIESTGTRVLQIIVGEVDPPSNLLAEMNGLWATPRTVRSGNIWRSFMEAGAREIDEWLFLPLHPEASSDDSEYELCAPDEKLAAFGRRINGSLRRASAPVTLKIRLEEGRRLAEYVSATFAASLESFQNLGGENVMLTTLLQMNDRLDMVNQYSERLQRPEVFNLHSLSAMNLSLADSTDDTNVAVLTSSGNLILKDIKMGG
jgi:hypothetical protein